MTRLLWLPMDLPPLPDVSTLINTTGVRDSFAYWKFSRLTEKKNSPYDISQWKQTVRDQCPQLISWFSNLPFVNIRNIKLNQQIADVERHIDFTKPLDDPDLWNNNHQNEPCGYRIIVKGHRTSTLWVEDSAGVRHWCNMPADTDVYILNHTGGYHGVSYDPGRFTIFCHAEIDAAAHATLLTCSLTRYADRAIWDIT